MNNALLVLLLEIDVTKGVNDKNLAILGDDPALLSSRSSRRIARRRRALNFAGLLGGATTLALVLLVTHAPFPTVHGLRRALVLVLTRSRLALGSRNVQVSSPSSFAGVLDITLDELLLALPAHVEYEVMDSSTADEEDADQDAAQARAVAVIVVIRALPQREAVGEVVIVALTSLATQDVGNEGETCLTLGGELDGILDLGRSRGLSTLVLALCALGAQLLSDLVGVKSASLCTVGLVNVVLRGGICDAEDLVEGGGGVSLVCSDLVTNAEDLTIC